MIIRIIAVGRLRERYWQDAASDFIRRIRPYSRLQIEEVAEAHIKENASFAEEAKVMQDEGRAILERLKEHSGPVVALDRLGKSLDSLQVGQWLQKITLDGQAEAAFVIGGPLGLAPDVLKRSDMTLSFSKMTFPHQMIRVILLEQIYRGFRIMHREPYHK
jgi:23S rRNA (pseudouridine1915-N3)-methyltransferase